LESLVINRRNCSKPQDVSNYNQNYNLKMSKKIYLITLLLISLNLHSQIRANGDFEITPKVGLSTSSYYVSGNQSSSVKSINYGINADYYLNKSCSIRTGLLFQKMGGKTGQQKFEIDYLNLPINANWHFGSTRKWNLNFGFTQSFKIGDSETQNSLGVKVKNNQSGLNVGIGYKIEISKNTAILLDYQFFSGLTNIDEDEIYEIKNKVGNINVGIVIKI
jgi:predicted porin